MEQRVGLIDINNTCENFNNHVKEIYVVAMRL